jgi:hypothetical protein
VVEAGAWGDARAAAGLRVVQVQPWVSLTQKLRMCSFCPPHLPYGSVAALSCRRAPSRDPLQILR